MVTQSRRQSLNLTELLQLFGHEFDFFQAVRLVEKQSLLENQRGDILPIGSDAPPDKESLSFSIRQSMAFASSDVFEIQQNNGKWNIVSNFQTLSGVNGVLPYHLSELIIKRIRLRDRSLQDFLDAINKRSMGIYYRAWKKYRLSLSYELHQIAPSRELPSHEKAFSALIGFGTDRIGDEFPVPREAMLGFGGMIGRACKPAVIVEKLVSHYLELPASVEQFIGQWKEIHPDMRSQLPCQDQPLGLNNELGSNVILGQTAEQRQSKFRVHLNDLNYQQFMSLRPGGDKIKQLTTLVRYSVSMDLDFDIRITIAKSELPLTAIDSKNQQGAMLGWNSLTPGGKPEERAIVYLTPDF